MRRYQYNVLRSIAAAGLFALVGCGGGNQPPAVQPPPQGNNPNGPVGLSGGLTDPNPGNPLNQQNYQQSLQALSQYFSGYGQATIRSQMAFNYVVQSLYSTNFPAPPQNQYNQQQNQMYPQQPTSQWQLMGQPQQEQIQVATFEIAANGTSVRFEDRYTGNQTFSFTYQVNLSGITLYSTDQVALFEGQGQYGYSILKVAYRGQNPVVQQYDISEMGGGGYGYGRRYRVVQKILATQFAYSPQQLQPQQYQPQQNYGGQQYTNNNYDQNPYFSY